MPYARFGWSPDSWQQRTALHQPRYADVAELDAVLRELSSLPPLVTSWEVLSLKKQLADAAVGQRFLLMGGDCAETFAECSASNITNKLKILLQMSLVLIHGSQKPIIRVGRFAGQYAKPRSDEFETRDGVQQLSYRGDLVNGSGFTAEERRHDPQRLLKGYERASLTLNFIRSLVKGGFADLHHPEYWDLDFVEHSPLAEEYRTMTGSIAQSLRFMESVLGVKPGDLATVDFFTSHEALVLHYEQAQTRRVPRHHGTFNLSTHMPWIGMRTADPSGAHVEYFRGIENPIAVKIGPSVTPTQLQRLLDTLHPDNEPGRLTLIHRFGASKIEATLPLLIEVVKASGKTVVWCCDPMHGNTKQSDSGYKTRDFTDILSELEQAMEIHARHHSILGGVHFELTGENVTECVGGARGLSDADLAKAYMTGVDPRLNYEQALEMALLLARRMHLIEQTKTRMLG